MDGNVRGCYLPLSRETALYPEIAAMEMKLGRRVVEDDLDNFAFHAFHGGGSSREAALHYFHTAYQGKPLLPPSRPQKAASAPTTKRPREVIYNQAIAIRHRYGLELEATLEAADRYRTSGRSLEREMTTQRMIEGKRRKLASRAAVKQAVTDICAA